MDEAYMGLNYLWKKSLLIADSYRALILEKWKKYSRTLFPA